MGSQQFCLKWNNHQLNMLSMFDELLHDEAFVDVTLACDGLSIKAHKMVLSACSPYFKHLFMQNPCKHPIVILKDVRYDDLKAIVDFMYKGEVNVSQDELNVLLRTAETLKVKGIAEVTGQIGGATNSTNPYSDPGMLQQQPAATSSSSSSQRNANEGGARGGRTSPSAKRKKQHGRPALATPSLTGSALDDNENIQHVLASLHVPGLHFGGGSGLSDISTIATPPSGLEKPRKLRGGGGRGRPKKLHRATMPSLTESTLSTSRHIQQALASLHVPELQFGGSGLSEVSSFATTSSGVDKSRDLHGCGDVDNDVSKSRSSDEGGLSAGGLHRYLQTLPHRHGDQQHQHGVSGDGLPSGMVVKVEREDSMPDVISDSHDDAIIGSGPEHIKMEPMSFSNMGFNGSELESGALSGFNYDNAFGQLFQSTPGTSAETAAQLRYKTYSLKKKLKAIAYAENHGNRAAGRHFLVDESCVRKWRQSKAKLATLPACRTTCRGGAPRYTDVEHKLYEWVNERRHTGVIITMVMMRAKAVEIAKELGYNLFGASPAWGLRFMERHALTVRIASSISQPRPEEWRELAREFQQRLASSIERKFIPPSNIFNMDEVAIAFEPTNGRTVDIVGSPDIRVVLGGMEKMGCSIVLCGSRDGQKLPPFIIFKSVHIPKEGFPTEVEVHVNSTGWMTEEAMLQWISHCWARRLCARHPRRSLLLLDNFSPHQMPGVVASFKLHRTEPRILPPGMTSLLQPMDATIVHQFKAGLKRSWSAWLSDGVHTFAPSGQIYAASPSEIAQWVVDSWNSISPGCIMDSFRHCLEEEVGVSEPIVEKDGLDFHRTGDEVEEDTMVVESEGSSSGEASGWSGLSDASPPRSPQHMPE